jgi:hypothetical protein
MVGSEGAVQRTRAQESSCGHQNDPKNFGPHRHGNPKMPVRGANGKGNPAKDQQKDRDVDEGFQSNKQSSHRTSFAGAAILESLARLTLLSRATEDTAMTIPM